MHNRQRHIRRARKGRDSAVCADRCARGTKQSAAVRRRRYDDCIGSLETSFSPSNLRHGFPYGVPSFLSLPRSRRPRIVSCLHRDPRPRSLLFKSPSATIVPSLPLFPRVVPLPFGVPQINPSHHAVPFSFPTEAGVAAGNPDRLLLSSRVLLFFYLFVLRDLAILLQTCFMAASVLFLLVPARARDIPTAFPLCCPHGWTVYRCVAFCPMQFSCSHPTVASRVTIFPFPVSLFELAYTIFFCAT